MEKTKLRKPRTKKLKPTKEIFDFKNLKGVRIEYFDDRFYKITIEIKDSTPEFIAELNQVIKNIPKNLVEDEGTLIKIYLPSSTTIIGNAQPNEFLARWRGDVGNSRADEISEIAMQKGSNIHLANERYAQGYAIIYQNLKANNISDLEIKSFAKKHKCKTHIVHTQDEMVQVARYAKLLQVLNPEIIATEQTVYSLEYAYGGTLDQVWKVKGGVYKFGRNEYTFRDGFYVVDFKTGKNYDELSYNTQLASYFKAFPNSELLQGYIIAHLNANIKTGIEGMKMHVTHSEDIEPYFEHFKRLRDTYFFINQNVRPSHYEIPQVLLYKRNK